MKKIIVLICTLVTLSNTIVNATCNADFSYTTSGSYVKFINTSQNIGSVSCSWIYGDGSSSADSNGDTAHYYNNGIYFVALTINDSGCISTKIDTIYINNSNTCNALFGIFPKLDSTFKVTIYNNSVANTNSVFLWNFGDLTPASNAISPNHSYSNFGKYRICLTVSDSNCTSTYCDSIGMDSTGKLYKKGGFEIQVINKSSIIKSTSLNNLNGLEAITIKVFPNPFTSRIYLKNNFKNVEVELYNAIGKLIYKGNKIEEQDFTSIEKDIYFLKINGSSQSIFKLIKE